MPALTKEQLNEVHRTLLELHRVLQLQLENSSDGARPVSIDQPIGRLTRMDAMQQQRMVQANRRAARTRLARIEAALRRYDGNEYGQCVACEEEIGYARLKARPETPFCIACQNRREAGET